MSTFAMGLLVALTAQAGGADAISTVEAGANRIQQFRVRLDVLIERLYTTEKKSSRGTAPFARKALPAGVSPTTERISTLQQRDKNGRRRIDFLDDKGQARETLVFDGESLLAYDSGKKELVIDNLAFTLCAEDVDYMCLYAIWRGQITIPAMLRSRQQLGLVTTKERSGSLVVAADPGNGSSLIHDAYGYQFFLDASKGLALTKRSVFKRMGSSDRVGMEIEATKFHLASNVWVPVNAEIRRLGILDGEPVGTVLERTLITVDLAHSSWNEDIDPSVFSLAVPEGTTVLDRKKKTKYLTGKTKGPDEHLESLVTSAKKLGPIDKPFFREPEEVSPWLYRILLLGLSGMLAAFLVIQRIRRAT